MENKKSSKTSKQLERYFKGAANRWRLDILALAASSGGITLSEIVEALRGNTKTLSDHTMKLVKAGLLTKHYRGLNVVHTLSPYGKKFYAFAKTF